MRKRIGIWISILLIFIFLHLLSGLIHSRAEIWMKDKLVSMLPEGSSIACVEWNILSSLKADSVVVGSLGFLSNVEVFYTPLGFLRRRIKSVSFYRPRLVFSFSGSTEHKGRKIPGLFYIEDISVQGGYIEWGGHEFLVNGNGRLFSTEDEIGLNVFKVSGSIDGLGFNLIDGQLNLERLGSMIDIRELRVGHSKLRIFGRLEKGIKGKGTIYLRDLKNVWNIEGEGVVEAEFVYDSLFRFKGKSGPISIEGINLEPLTFHGNTDSIWINGSCFKGYLKSEVKTSGSFELSDLNMKDFRKDLPPSKLNGSVDFCYLGRDSLSFRIGVFGVLMGSHLRDFNVEFKKLGRRIIVDQFEGYLNKGSFSFSGEYDNLIKGNLFVDGVEVSPILKYFGINIEVLLYADINLRDKVYGVFSFDSLKYGKIQVGLVDGNIDLRQKEKKFLGELSFVMQDVELPGSKIFEIGEGVARLNERDVVLVGLFKREDKQMEYSLQYFKDSIKFEKLNFAYPGGWLMLDSSFSARIDEGIKADKAIFKGNKGEEVNLSLEVYQKKLKGKVRLDKFNLRMLDEFDITPLPLSGDLGGLITLSGRTNAPEIKFKGKSRAKWKGESVGDSLNLELGYQKENIVINNITLFENSHHSRFNGAIDLSNGLLNIKAEFDSGGRWISYPLHDYLDTRRIEVNGNIAVKGKLLTPEVYGEIKVSKGNILLVKPGIKIEDLSADVEFNGYKGLIKSSRVSLSEGNIGVKGDFDIGKRSYNFKININKTPINWQYVNALIDGNVTVSEEEEKIRVEGVVDLNKTIISMPFRMEGNGGKRPPNLYLDIKVDAGEGNVWIRNDMADMELVGGIGVQYDGGPLLISGNMEVKQGNFYYLYRSFDVVKGEFDFKNSPELNPNIDIEAKTIAQERDTVFLDVSGTMKMPKFELYSKPARSVADIMTLLNLNMSWEDLSSLKAIEESVTEVAFNYWVRQTFSRRFKQKFGIDLVRMEGEGGHYEIVLGKYITDRLFVKARTDILFYGISEIQAEYRIKRWGSIVAENYHSGDTRLLFKLGWRY